MSILRHVASILKGRKTYIFAIAFIIKQILIMKNIRTEVIIDAPITTVWDILMDFKDYPNWNPFIHITGDAKVGQQLENTIFLEGQKPQIFKPQILEVQPQKKLRWEGYLFIKGLFDGEHYFQLEGIHPQQTHLIHGENFKGILVGMVFKMIGKATEEGFNKMNHALKEQCERALIEI